MPDAQVTFVLPGLRATGGVRAVFEISDRLLARGRPTRIVVPERTLLAPHSSAVGLAQRYGPRWLSPLVQRLAPRREMAQSWFDLKTPLVVAGPDLTDVLPDSGPVIATSYRTAEELLGWSGLADRGVYLIQGYEVWDGPRRRVDRTWRSFDRIIATSPALAERARSLGAADVVLAPYGVDQAAFTPDDRRDRRSRPTVGFLWDDRSFKGGPVVVEALGRLRGEGMDFDSRAFGLGTYDLPAWIDSVGPASGDDLVDFYRSLDLFVCMSSEESGPMTLPEAMACGVATLSTDVGCVQMWSSSGSAIRVVPQDDLDVERCASELRRLLADQIERERLARAGHAAIRPFTWDAMTDVVERSLRGWFGE